jgi:hypothetical protein
VIYLTEYTTDQVPEGAFGRRFAGPDIEADSWREAKTAAHHVGKVRPPGSAGSHKLAVVGVLDDSAPAEAA